MPSPSILLGVGAVLSTLSAPAFAAKYEAQDSYNGRNWLDAFKFETYEKTNGFVNYVDEATAKSMKLYKTEGNDVLFGVDSGETLDSADGGDIGRKSVRLEGKKEYNHGLFIIDVKAMPNVCGMWPAFWSLGREPWPVKGEIDIIEGVNKNTVNKYVLHTDTQCSTDGLGQSGNQLLKDCALNSPSGASGCDVNDARTNSWGAGFNSNGGGIYAMEWDSDAIKTWFFPRGSSLPASLTKSEPDTSDFGIPAANFKGDCNIDKRFQDQRFIFTNTFCGDWAGNVYAQSGCPTYNDAQGQPLSSMASCKKYVAENPKAFKDAFWRISSFKTFQKKKVTSSSVIRTSTRASSSPIRSSTPVRSSTIRSSTVRSSSARASSTHVRSSSVHVSSSVYHPGSSTPVASSSVHYPASSSLAASSEYPVSSSVAPSSEYPVSSPAPSSVYPEDYPVSTPVDYPASSAAPSYPVKGDDEYPEYPASSSYPVKGDDGYPVYPASSPAPEYPAGNTSYPVYPGTGYPAQSTPCSTGVKPHETPVYPVYPDSETSVPVYGDYPAKPSKSVHNDYPELPEFTPLYPTSPEVTSKPVYGDDYDTTPASKTTITTTYTTTYVDVCETGYTTITTTHTATYCPTTTPAAKPTPGSEYPVYPPPGFEVTTKVCNKGCGSGPQTVTVTLPCTKCGGYPTEETPVPYSTTKVYVTKTVTVSKVTVHSEYPAYPASPAAPEYPEYPASPASPVYPVVHPTGGYPVIHPSGGYPKSNVTASYYGTGYSTGTYKPTKPADGYKPVPTKTAYDAPPEFTGAASSFKAAGVVVVAAFAALLF